MNKKDYIMEETFQLIKEVEDLLEGQDPKSMVELIILLDKLGFKLQMVTDNLKFLNNEYKVTFSEFDDAYDVWKGDSNE